MYTIVPCTFDPDHESVFVLTVLSDAPCKVRKEQIRRGEQRRGKKKKKIGKNQKRTSNKNRSGSESVTGKQNPKKRK